MLQRIKRAFTALEQADLIKKSGLFDRVFYTRRYPDVLTSRLNPMLHYLNHGGLEGRNPNPVFDSAWYLSTYPDAAGTNPLLHYILSGEGSGYNPSASISIASYVAEQNLPGPTGALKHYLSNRYRPPAYNADLNFDALFYRSYYKDIPPGDDQLAEQHYHEIGVNEGRHGNAQSLVQEATERKGSLPRNFDETLYLTINKDVAKAFPYRDGGALHYLLYGRDEKRRLQGKAEEVSEAPDHLRSDEYAQWLDVNQPSEALLDIQRRMAGNLAYKPVISVIVPVYKVAPNVLEDTIVSVLNQSYPYLELCLSFSYFETPQLIEIAKQYSQNDSRLKYQILAENGGISRNSNETLNLASGEYIALLDHDDTLTPDALFEVAKALNDDAEIDFIYSDKDMVDESGRLRGSPLFKPDWSPEIMLSANYLTHFNVMRRSIIDDIGGWDVDTDGAQDWDIFLRCIHAGKKIYHIPKVLYNWRIVATSVAAGGLAAKPYAAKGQLTAVQRHLRANGWTEAEPFFVAPNEIKIKWSENYHPKVGLILVGPKTHGKAAKDTGKATDGTYYIQDINHIDELNQLIDRVDADVIVIRPSIVKPTSSDWLEQITGPLENADIGIVTGKLLGSQSNIIDAGWVDDDRELKPLFAGLSAHHYTHIGSADWYRNLAAASFATLAFRKADWAKINGFQPSGRPDLDFSRRIITAGRRILYNPYAESTLPVPLSISALLKLDSKPYKLDSAPERTYFNKHLKILASGQVVLRNQNAIGKMPPFDYSAEAGYVALTFDYTPALIETSKRNARQFKRKVRTIAWLVPPFDMPFYGGIMTVLRLADYLRRTHNIASTFVSVGGGVPTELRYATSLAYPELAAGSRFFAMFNDGDINDLGIGPIDASVCTLWTTAYAQLPMKNVAKKFYLVQDYEPLFYPAGSTSSLVEATYRFGYHALCNTEPLADLYRTHGGKADHFVPAIDTNVFHQKGRQASEKDQTVTIFNYARPGHPRNCFETVSMGLKMVKEELGDKVRILTAGSDWDAGSYDLENVVNHLGLLSYKDTGHLYRACDIGVVAMATRHPSYLPFELMACGATVCTNASPYTDWLLKNGENSLLFDLTRSSIADKVIQAATDSSLRKKLAADGAKLISHNHSNWDAVCERIFGLINSNT